MMTLRDAAMYVIEQYDAYAGFWDADGKFIPMFGEKLKGYKHRQVHWVSLDELRAALDLDRDRVMRGRLSDNVTQ